MVLPCIAMMMAPKQMQSALLPAVAKDKDALAENFVPFVLAGSRGDRTRSSSRSQVNHNYISTRLIGRQCAPHIRKRGQ
jgi:hypothetical protein